MRRSSQAQFSAVAGLEVRQLLAGNVLASVVDGVLTVTGDAHANEVAIEQTSSGLQVKAINGTKLNGVANGSLVIANPAQTNIDLKGGNDKLKLEDFLGGGVKVHLGVGDDELKLEGIAADGALTIDLGSGHDKLSSSLGGDSGTDANVVGGNLTVKGGLGNDRIEIGDLNALAGISVDAGVGGDIVGLGTGYTDGATSVLLGDGNDIAVVAERVSRGPFTLNAGKGDDLLGLRAGDYRQTATFEMGAGKDAILSQSNSFLGNVTHSGGTGVGPKAIDTFYSATNSYGGGNAVTGFEILTTSESAVSALFAKLLAAFPA